MRIAVALLLSLTTACVAAQVEPAASLSTGMLGDRLEVADGIIVRPKAVFENSRCPSGTQCVWAGQVVLDAQILELGNEREIRFTLGEPVAVAGGNLSLVEASPYPRPDVKTLPEDYRLGFAFTPKD